MKRTIWRIIVLAGGLSSVSCAQWGLDHQTARRQAEERWSDVRAKIKLQIATESFARGELDEAQKQLDEALALDAKLPDAHLLRARILLERGEIASAQEALKIAISHGADNAAADYLGGVIAERYGRLSEALTAYRRAAERNPRDAHYVVAVAETLVALGSTTEALALIESRWTDFEHNATLRATAGQIYTLMGRYDRAADVYRDAVRISPDDATLQYQLGMTLALAGKNTEAVAVLAPLARKEKDLPGYVLVALGRAHLGTGQTADAKTVLRRATAVSPESLSAWTWLARAALAGNDLVTAREAAARATEIGTDAAETFILLGYVCLRQGHHAAAVRALETALQKEPNDALALRLLDQARRAGDNPGKARNVGENAVVAPAVHRPPPVIAAPNTEDEPDSEEIVRRANNALRSGPRGEVPLP